MIELIELTRRFGQTLAVDGLSFRVDAGEVLGFLGPNGAGKTTTMKLVTGFLTPTSGDVQLFGRSVRDGGPELRGQLGYLPEGAPLYGEMTPDELLRFILRLQRRPATSAALAAVIEPLALQSVLHRRIEDLSKGFRRRVGLAAALVHQPRILLLDEPTDGLDPNQKHEVRELIRGLSKDKIVIVSTHILEEVDAVCSRALLIANGRKVADARPDELAARSRFHGALTVNVRDAGERSVLELLGAAAGVAAVERASQGTDRFVVFPDAALRGEHPATCGQRLLDSVRAAAGSAGVAIDVLDMQSGRLDDVFRELTAA